MAINKRFPHVYDAEYVWAVGGISEVNLFRRSAATTVTYVDASGATVTRAKGFEDTNMTEDGRVNETGIILQTVGVSIKPGPREAMSEYDSLYDEMDFFERGFAELVLNDNQVVFTARLRDLPVMANTVPAGVLQVKLPQDYYSGATRAPNMGRPYPAGGIRIPRGVRFALNLKWNRPLVLKSQKTCRIEAEMWGVSDELAAEDRAFIPQVAATALPVAQAAAR